MNNCPFKMPEELPLLAEKSTEYMAYESPQPATWCSGCGNYGIQKALERALTLENIKPHETVMVFDIGCHGNGSDKINGNTLHGLHGRVISLAAGAALANPKLKVIAHGGDGGILSEGVGHLVHAVRSDYPMLFILHNNENYGLTTGQASAATRKGLPMNGSPDGVILDPMVACQFVMTLHPSFVARTFSGDLHHMTKILRAALNHKGFAFVEIMQVCPTYNKATSPAWFWDRVRDVEKLPSYNPTDWWQAMKAVEDLDKEIMMGVLYKKDQPNFLERLPNRKDVKTALTEEVGHHDISALLEEMK
ncbi:2-oxoacid ferredoxin oxidoreductase [Candidatus Peregrinibacteria bacterium]|nr:2-oxoacid ferredoxin oxidoreductase [Candidatus Peregrinibacteria bacterium]